MSNLTFRLPLSLLNRLNSKAKRMAVTRGELVRQALEQFLQQNFSSKKINWDDIYAKTRVDTGLTPEEEVAQSRRRYL